MPTGSNPEIPRRLAPIADLSGRNVGSFSLLRRLGQGAMSEVYLAEQTALRRRVALKVLRPELAKDQVFLRRFELEAQAAASLVHANIVQIYEVGHSDGFHYIAEEYVPGMNLRDWMARRGIPSVPEVVSIMRQVAAALVKAAEQGVVHRDLKPENIMLTANGEVKVADFGLAQIPRQEEAVGLTQVGMTVGTPLYMSPEQVEGKAIDHRSDLYSLGATSYHMLSGAPPFQAETSLGVAVQHLKKEPASLEILRPDLPAVLCRLVHQLLAKEVERRPQSARQLLQQLRTLPGEWQEIEPLEALPVGEVTEPDLSDRAHSRALEALGRIMENQPPPSRSRLRWAIMAAVAAMFLIGGVIGWMTSRQPSLLAGAATLSGHIPQQPTALQQYLDASRIGTKEAWQSVIDYFPEKQYARRAQQQLARIYLREGDYAKALAIFNKFVADEADPGLRAFGLAGKCGVLTLQGKYQESAEVLARLWPIRAALQDTQMQQLLDYVIEKNRSELGAPSTQQWDQWLAEKLGEGD